VKKLFLVGTTVLLMATSASAGPEPEHRGHWVAPGQWQMNDIGRNHGMPRYSKVQSLGIPGMCSPVSWAVQEGSEAVVKKALLTGVSAMFLATGT
jgi:hypothetical protein